MSPFRTWRQWLLARDRVGLAGAAQAGEHVDWLDDGTVLLKLGPDYGDAVIETSRAELGSLFGPDAQPFAGATIRVLSQDEGRAGRSRGRSPPSPRCSRSSPVPRSSSSWCRSPISTRR